ncbi:MAG: glycosyltransferase [Clostridia bacterium]|nr:glycosyltransferase [Clostridia bacterium]
MYSHNNLNSTSFHYQKRIIYALNHSYPFSSNGYAVRSHGIASALARLGFEVIAITRPGIPWDRAGYCDTGLALENIIEGVRYIHLPCPRQAGKAMREYLDQAAKKVMEVLQIFQPCAVMAASNWHNARPWAQASRSAGLPFFYEVRGFWEISQASRDPAWVNSAEYLEAVRGETNVAKVADRVFTINRHMRNELVQRGIAADRIELVPNGFPGWPPPPQNGNTRASLGIHSRYVIGYIGSFNVYEGMEDLIEAVARLRARDVDASLLLVGSSTQSAGMAIGNCGETEIYRAMAARLGIAEHVVLPGRVAPELTAAYYQLMDVVCIPRRPFAVCEIVSPMKPLEAAAHGKRVLLSDVAPLADLEGLCPNFSYFAKGDIASLTDTLGEILAAGDFSPPRHESLAEHTWDNNVAPMVRAFQSLSTRKNCTVTQK